MELKSHNHKVNEACGSSHLDTVLSCPVTDPTGCNILSDMAVHDVDMIVWLTQGQEPEFIYVITHSHDAELAEAGVADSITVLLKYKSGVIAAIDSCRETTYGYDIRVEVSGEWTILQAELCASNCANVRLCMCFVCACLSGFAFVGVQCPKRFHQICDYGKCLLDPNKINHSANIHEST